jgi:hypothetical protein
MSIFLLRFGVFDDVFEVSIMVHGARGFPTR